MPLLPADHPEREVLAEEVHARPPVPVETPSRASYVAVLVGPDDRERERQHLAALCAQHAVEPPAEGATQFSARLGTLLVKWERHGEFSGYTFFASGSAQARFDDPAVRLLPESWLAGVPGVTIAAVHGLVLRWGEGVPTAAALAEYFDAHIVVGAELAEGAGVACTDFKLHNDRFARVLLLDRSFTPRQAGRMLQRLFEIEAYRMMALLALPVARRLSPRILSIERSLATLTDSIAQDAPAQSDSDEALLQQLTRLAAEVESSLATSQFRFGACRAYFELVETRIGELREQRVPGMQTIEEFMARRFTPAVATCNTVSQRLHDLSERVAQASALLSTRVDITRERQNQALLASMDRRAKLQLRLQQTVEGLSVAAIVYYAAGLVGYLAKGLKAGGAPLDADLVVGLAIPVLMVLVLLALRRARKKIAGGTSPHS
ncbi:MAG TPA: DUF3422 domain-containing protein [Rubrivivax sp.]